MKLDPIDIAQEIGQAYATDFIGDRSVVFSNLLNRYGDPTTPLGQKLITFIKMKGPYVQALPVPKWSNTTWTEFARSVKSIYAPNGIDKRIIDLFSEIGFRKLYAYQERAIKAILNDNNALIVAGTGRGKTESWLVPILQFILKAKRGEVSSHPPNSVKAVLVYPTKALAQDQLKRLITYLFKLNKSLPENERVTVGVYDGDTPSLADMAHMAYLANAFKYFKCPMFNSAHAVCRACDERYNNYSLIVRKNDEGIPKLFVPTPECRDRIPLDFIHLTRDDIKDAKVDILLTNPDTINFRLVNINADIEREAFIKEPKYIVLDEIHTLTGLFGSFVSVLMKRLLLVRSNLIRDRKDDLRIIAASATIRNKEEIFSKISPFQHDVDIIEEEREQIIKDLPPVIPNFLKIIQFTKEDILAEAQKYSVGDSIGEAFLALFRAFRLERDYLSEAGSDEELEVRVKEKFFENITSNIKETPNLDIFRALYSVLLRQAHTPEELLRLLAKHYSRLDSETLKRIIHNFLVIAELSGILENRVHLFSWPLDGYYLCVNCGKVYDTPQGECERCHHHFITRMVVCGYCDEEAIESWFCPKCLKLYTLESNVEGKPTYLEPLKCNCSGQETICVRVVWRPYFLCPNCGRITKWDLIQRCETCGSRMMVDESGSKLICTNLMCNGSTTSLPVKRCPKCHSDLKLLANEILQCPACGRKVYSWENTTCECGSMMHPVLYLPWVCDNPKCDVVINSDTPPPVCQCGSKKFFLVGLFDVTYAYYCKDCDAYFLRQSCNKPDHVTKLRLADFTEYKLVAHDFGIRRPIESRRAVPCYHPYIRYMKSSRYIPLARSPENVAVTSAQYALRKIIGFSEQKDLLLNLKKAKMLSFADSHGDMERLNRDFQEPEQEWFIDQLIVSVLEQSEQTLSNLYIHIMKEFDERQIIYPKSLDLTERLQIKPRQKGLEKDELLKSEVDRRIFSGYYYGRRESPRLVIHGIIDVRLSLRENIQLTDDEKQFLKALYGCNNVDVGWLSEDLSPRLHSPFDNTLEQLELKGLVVEEKGRIRINPERIIVTLVSKDNPILWDPAKDTFYPKLSEQLGEEVSHCIPFNVGYKDRTKLFEPIFSKTAYRIAYSSPIMLLSEAYKGTTEKTVRRELEYQFKNGCYPNFLSSGPAMELGIDIGDLDLLCLFGTPPNINSYLQRIGRAGRETKKSLVFSVSKRNPIDYYYYKYPLDLIQSSPQPVPLNEHNPEVLRISLVWALMDFIATKFWVPWRKEHRPDGVRITDGEEVVRIERSSIKPDNIEPFTSVYASKNIELNYGDRLRILDKIVKDNKSEAKAWLEALLNYSFCPRCGQHYPPIYVGACQSPGCSETVVRAKDRFSDMVNYALNTFSEHFVSLASDFVKQLRVEERRLTQKRWVIEEELEVVDPSDKGAIQRLRLFLEDLENRIVGLQTLRREIEQMAYSEFHKRSKENKYAFQIRSVEEGVDIVYFKEDSKTKRFTPVLENREIAMAVREYHPYGVSLFARRKRVACRIIFDEWKSTVVKQAFPDQLICISCYTTYDDLQKLRCDYCEGELRLLQTLVPRRIEVYPDTYPLRQNVEEGRGIIRPLDIHPLTEHDRTVRRTFPNAENKVIDFKVSNVWDLQDSAGKRIGSIEYGEISLATLVGSYNCVYEEGFMDPTLRLFELCGVEGCNAVVVQKGDHICAMDPNHDPFRKKYVRLAYIFKTYGIRVSTEEGDGIVAHTLAHGIRMALQGIAGVHIRNIGEVYEENCAYVYDSEPGGSGVTTLLVALEDGKYRNFEYASKLIDHHLSACKCDDGCPHCIYQFGCAERNSPRTLSRTRTKQWMNRGLVIAERPSS